MTILETHVNPANKHTYLWLSETTWSQAEQEAISLGGHLVTINDAKENAWLVQTFGSYTNSTGSADSNWIGLNDFAHEGEFVWASGEPVSYTHFYPGEPNNSGDSIHIYGVNATSSGETGYWDDWEVAWALSVGWNVNPNDGFRAIVEISNNHAATGTVIINDTTPELNQILTVSNTLVDKDGLGTISYAWNVGGIDLGTNIAFPSNTLLVADNWIGKTITVTASYIDGLGNPESVTSAETSAVTFAKLIINGTAENDVLTGENGDDKLYGYAGDDALKGGDGNDSLSGGTGKDKLEGNTGDDVLNGGSGNDTLFGNIGDDIERGDAGNDRLWGIRGHDTLDGGMGDDKLMSGKDSNLLTGGEGMDSFRFFATSGSTITDFVIADDSIELKKTFFAVGSKGVLNSDSFVNGSVALDANDFILYETESGFLMYDSDGNGAGAAVQIALLGISEHPALTAADFAVV